MRTCLLILFLFCSVCKITSTRAQKIDSLDFKIGQMLLIGFPGQKVDSAVLKEIRDGKVGSIIIFEKNIPPANSFVALKKLSGLISRLLRYP
jgi:beta-N-acetylhexosaminidase